MTDVKSKFYFIFFLFQNENNTSNGQIIIATYAGTLENDTMISLFELNVKLDPHVFIQFMMEIMIFFYKQVHLFVKRL